MGFPHCQKYFADYYMLIVALSTSVRWEGTLWRKIITNSESAVNGVTFYSSQETLAGEQDWLLSCVNSQRLWINPSCPRDTDQYRHGKIGCMGCK
jgi:hypothetical protein